MTALHVVKELQAEIDELKKDKDQALIKAMDSTANYITCLKELEAVKAERDELAQEVIQVRAERNFYHQHIEAGKAREVEVVVHIFNLCVGCMGQAGEIDEVDAKRLIAEFEEEQKK